LALLERIDLILEVLKQATFYSILAPLSAALRQAVWGVKDTDLDNSQTPEVASMRSLQQLAEDARNLLSTEQLMPHSSTLFGTLSEIPDGESVLERFNQWLERYGYLSEVATDIAIPTWKEDPRPVRDLFAQFLTTPPRLKEYQRPESQGWKVKQVQSRLNLKGRVTEVYSQLLAELRWSFVALEQVWLELGLLAEAGDIFFLEFAEIRRLVESTDAVLRENVSQLIQYRRSQLDQNRQITAVPPLVYGNAPSIVFWKPSDRPPKNQLRGIGASPGQIEGRVKVLRNLQMIADIDRQTILVVPYTDSGWAPLLARAGGLIAEVGGRLSHGAIVAREYGIPAIMDIHNATHLLQDGQRVRMDGSTGIVEVL
jgi:phosphohistidine swiveling domain-containing protein